MKFSLIHRFQQHKNHIKNIDFSLDEKYLSSSCGDFQLFLFDCLSGKQDLSFPLNPSKICFQSLSHTFGASLIGTMEPLNLSLQTPCVCVSQSFLPHGYIPISSGTNWRPRATIPAVCRSTGTQPEGRAVRVLEVMG